MGSDGQQAPAISSDDQLGPGGDDRGYTGHEHLDELGFVHMNGRIYDPLLGRFLSPDPHIQAEELLQNYNRYSYVLNNPLRYTDPSGEFWQIPVFIIGMALAASNNKDLKVVGTLMMMVALNGTGTEKGLLEMVAAKTADTLVPAITSAVSAAISYTIAYGPEAGIKAGVFAAAFTLAGDIPGALSPQRIMAHALLGCLQQASSGGQCGPGAAAAAFGKIATGMAGQAGINSGPAQFAITTVVGGTASVIGGGKFANGAAQAGFGYLFNAASGGGRGAGGQGKTSVDLAIERAIVRNDIGELQTMLQAANGEQAALINSVLSREALGRGVTFARSQLQHAFSHARDFGVNGTANTANLARFEAAVQQHVTDAATTVIHGSFRRQSVTHFLNPSTGLNVIRTPDGAFLSGWRLSPQQLQNVITHGRLGGG